jgi:hypothetical protein
LKKENTTQYVNHWVSSTLPALSIALILSYAGRQHFSYQQTRTRENEADEIGKDLAAIVKEDEKKVNESNAESEEYF